MNWISSKICFFEINKDLGKEDFRLNCLEMFVCTGVGVGVIVEIKKKIIPGRMPIFKKS